MSPKPYPLGNANLSTCEWFVPELARWASRLKLDDDHAPTLPAGPHPRLILTEQDITRINVSTGSRPKIQTRSLHFSASFTRSTEFTIRGTVVAGGSQSS